MSNYCPYYNGSPTQAGGKRSHSPHIDVVTATSLSITVPELVQFRYADVFTGAGGYSLHRKLLGCTALHSNDLGDLNSHLIQALIANDTVKLDLSTGLTPDACDDFVRREMCPLVFPAAHGLVLDWLTSTARAKTCPI